MTSSGILKEKFSGKYFYLFGFSTFILVQAASKCISNLEQWKNIENTIKFIQDSNYDKTFPE